MWSPSSANKAESSQGLDRPAALLGAIHGSELARHPGHRLQSYPGFPEDLLGLFRLHRTAIEEVTRLECEADPLDGHGGPVLRAGDVVDVQDVPSYHVLALDGLAVEVSGQGGAQRA